MLARNFNEMTMDEIVCHDGEGLVLNSGIYGGDDFDTAVRFINYTVLPPGTTIGSHKHGNDEEVYVILEGRGVMEVEGESRDVTTGAVILNRPFWTHGLRNDSDSPLKILVVGVGGKDA